jgi:hypothetical protein
MARTTFSGPVKSDNGFEGNVTGNVTGNITGNVVATTVTATGAISGLTLTATGTGGAKLGVVALASLPAAAAGNAGTIYYVSGTSSGNTLVFSNGTANIDLLTGIAVIA